MDTPLSYTLLPPDLACPGLGFVKLDITHVRPDDLVYVNLGFC
jgi:hypothetical protein